MLNDILDAAKDGILTFLLIMSLLGYIESQWPWMPEHDSKPYTETEYWLAK